LRSGHAGLGRLDVLTDHGRDRRHGWPGALPQEPGYVIRANETAAVLGAADTAQRRSTMR
jgi:hypothetical protein